METQPERAINIFMSYAQEDKDLKRELDNHLTALKGSGQVAQFVERRVEPDGNWSEVVDPRLSTSDIYLILLSANLMGSGYCSGAEFNQALERLKAGQARLVPIVVRRIDLEGTPLVPFQDLPGTYDGRARWKPVTAWADRDEAWWRVVRGIRQIVDDLRHSPHV